VRQTDGWTPLHLAASNDGYVSALFLLEHGADPYAINNDNQTPFDIATARVRDAMIRAWRPQFGSVCGSDGRAGRCEELGMRVPDKVLLERYVRCVNPLGDPEFETALCVPRPPSRGANADAAAARRWTSTLRPAAPTCRTSRCGLRSPPGAAPPGRSSRSPDAVHSDVDAVKALLASGAEVDTPGPINATPLMSAASSGAATAIVVRVVCGCRA
jgi:hypothetical protein